MSGEQDGGDRTEEATPRKRDEARKQGQVAMSSEVSVALTMVLLTGLIGWVFPSAGRDLVAAFRSLLVLDASDVARFDLSSVNRIHELQSSVIRLVGPIAAASLALGVAANVAQVGIHINVENIGPKWDRLDPSGWFKRMAGVELPVTLGKALFKGLGIVAIATFALRDYPQALPSIALAPVGALPPRLADVAFDVLVRVAAALVVVAGIDVLWTRYRHEEKLKMSKDEVKRESKEAFGDPHVKAARKRRMAELTQKSLENAVKEATVVTVNPTHYSVALRYWEGRDAQPLVIAKGVDFKAKRIRALAEKHGVPVIQDIPLTRALYKATREGDAIPLELFQAVAKLLALVYRARDGR